MATHVKRENILGIRVDALKEHCTQGVLHPLHQSVPIGGRYL